MNRCLIEEVQKKPLGEIIRSYPVTENFLENLRLANLDRSLTFEAALTHVTEETLDDFGITTDDVLNQFYIFLEHFSSSPTENADISCITIEGGQDKNGNPEDCRLDIHIGEVVSIVGPTGSGKSRLLEDIECLAQGDSPTKRRIYLNHMPVPDDIRFDLNGKLVAQLSQNMNFVMDLTVKEFLELHARCRLRGNYEKNIEKCYTYANKLAGEKFSISTKVTQLSGGQSRALMIADTAFMSSSPIVLVDEIENAGINRREAIELLAHKEKIVLLSTHDPLLALSASKRIVIKNGGISRILTTTAEERQNLKYIEKLDTALLAVRENLRQGKRIETVESV